MIDAAREPTMGVASVCLTVTVAILLILSRPVEHSSNTLSDPTPVDRITPEQPVLLESISLPPPPIPVPKAVPVETLKPQPTEKPSSAKEKQPLPSPNEKQQPVVVAPTTVDIKDGRILLRQMEVGDGPAVEIAWPENHQQRQVLHKRFVSCYGMVTAVLGSDGYLYRSQDQPGQSWALNADRYSGFVRQASGETVDAEARVISTIQQRHRLSGGTAVRLFPRSVDAMMLGGLQRLIGQGLGGEAALQARYVLDTGSINITDIAVNGVLISGRVQVPSGC